MLLCVYNYEDSGYYRQARDSAYYNDRRNSIVYLMHFVKAMTVISDMRCNAARVVGLFGRVAYGIIT